ncbi:uncharacterized protein Bfra_004600 [Botrytis fragariae]|uniref:Uncharacterized protein n=1 Tax=Botrytis fragariae TaxID=1964551 RepID=A0A8H6EJL4_9HELO|nr:uncharacterized protein Bfra_004600 [Botrytis fragariae]KAF5874589.1 hypothetical protein Bfra_004600 [Botrytis fragariae]
MSDSDRNIFATKFRQAKSDLDGMIEKLHVQNNKDRKVVGRLRLRLPRLEIAKTRATANDDLRSRHKIDRELEEIPVRHNEITAEMDSMVEDINKIFTLILAMTFYRLALQRNTRQYYRFRDEDEKHGQSVILLGKFSEDSPKKAVEVARLVFGVSYKNAVRVNLLDDRCQASVNWDYTLLCEFTERWFSVMCGSVNEPLDKSDLEILGKRFWNTMISINGKEEWMAHERFKAEKFWAWLAARTKKLNLRNEMSNVQEARFQSYSHLLDQWLNGKIRRPYQDDTSFDHDRDRKIYHKLQSSDIQEKEWGFSKSESKLSRLVKELLRDGRSNLEIKRGDMLIKARGAMSEAVCFANAGEGYSDSLKLADKMLQLNGTSREAWLGKLLFELSALALLDTSRHYLHPTASELKKGERQAPEALDELDKQRKEFLATISHQPAKSRSNWRYNLYVRIDDHLKNATGKDRERRVLKNQLQKAKSDYGTLEDCLKLCNKLLPRSHTGRERSPKISQTHSPRGRSNETRDSVSDTARRSSRKPASSKPVPTPK